LTIRFTLTTTVLNQSLPTHLSFLSESTETGVHLIEPAFTKL